ncbi:Cd(II)/Pb(II)-responsive transcriptional regulator [Cellvibrio fibrivorans]|jgi:Cd(II)/Pb(II)-responsive transcriptional regulator|uniref:Cd(II)/Pb(II)-responsive transcriptional regulator n=1 Tax=Cellvibrio fibrivorans TaxID=126350 RepID=A0ABU1UX50_9GAMM|nr:Cd(II)/Pb(II)-responsive transcriptional regulator [Cellvibrio fibrivorans]MDR7089774.1 Cd(II)/Pb(II)-responsive transcriptional regulator [Cellvibrio fibrivorans]
MKIGTLAKQTGVPVQTIRFYEQEGLVSVPQRTEGNYRLYDTDSLRQLGFIKQCRNLGLTLGEIRELIRYQATPEKACEEINHIVDTHVQEVDARIAELTALRAQLVGLRTQCNDNRAVKDCGILQALTKVE